MNPFARASDSGNPLAAMTRATTRSIVNAGMAIAAFPIDTITDTLENLGGGGGESDSAAAGVDFELDSLLSEVRDSILINPSPALEGAYGLPASVITMAYNAGAGLLAASTFGGSVHIVGGPGVDTILGEDRQGGGGASYLGFSQDSESLFLVGVSTGGAVTTWDVAKGRMVGHVMESAWPSGTEVSAVHIPRHSSHGHIFLGTAEGRVHACAVGAFSPSGYNVEPSEIFAGIDGPLGRRGASGPCVSIDPHPSDDHTALIAFGPSGAVVQWDWVRRRRVAMWEGGRRTITCVSWRPNGHDFAVGFSDGAYALGHAGKGAKQQQLLLPLWLGGSKVDPDACSSVSHMQWLRANDEHDFLLVAGGHELNGNEEQECGVTLLSDALQPSTSCSSFFPMWQPSESLVWTHTALEANGRSSTGEHWLTCAVLALLSSSMERQQPGIGGHVLYERTSRFATVKICATSRSDIIPGIACRQYEHLLGYDEVTAVALTEPMPAMMVLNLASLSLQGGSVTDDSMGLLRGGSLAWHPAAPADARCEATSLSQVAIWGHADGSLSFWELCAPGPCDNEVAEDSKDARLQPCAQPLGRLPLLSWLEPGAEGGHQSAITAMGLLAGGDGSVHLGVGFDSGLVAVLALGSNPNDLFTAEASAEVAAVHILGDGGDEEGQHDIASASDNIVLPQDGLHGGGNDVEVSRTGEKGNEENYDDLAEAIAAAQAEAHRIVGAHTRSQDQMDVHLSGRGVSNGTKGPAPQTVRYVLRLHSYAICAVSLCWDPLADSVCLAVADAGGVASISHVQSREALILQTSPPDDLPCMPSLSLGPCPASLISDSSPCSGALYLLVGHRLSVYSTSSGDMLVSVDMGGARPSRSVALRAPPFVACVDDAGAAFERRPGMQWQVVGTAGVSPHATASDPKILVVGLGRLAILSCEALKPAGDSRATPRSRPGIIAAVTGDARGSSRSGLTLKATGALVKGRQHAAAGIFQLTTLDGSAVQVLAVIDYEDGISTWLLPSLSPLESGLLCDSEGLSLLKSRAHEKLFRDAYIPPPAACISPLGEVILQTAPQRLVRFRLTRHRTATIAGVHRMSKVVDLGGIGPSGLTTHSKSPSSQSGAGKTRMGRLFLKSSLNREKMTLRDTFLSATAVNWHDQQREELFSGAQQSGRNAHADGVARVKAEMSEVAERAQERGEKLSKMEEKTRRLENDAADFADMARQLNQQLDRESEACQIS